MSEETLYDVAIIGGGPGGLAAAIYTCRSRLQTLLIDSMGGGGQLNIIDHIENYPGVVPQSGLDLATRMREQAESFGATVTFDEVAKVSQEGERLRIQGASGSFLARTLIVASGARHKELCIPSEERLKGRGVSYCATCDGAFFKGQHVAMVGGGDTAVKEALYLSKIVDRVTLIHRRGTLRAEKVLQERLFERPNVDFRWDSVVEEIQGADGVRGLILKNLKTGVRSELAVSGVFVFIGILPNTDFLRGLIQLDSIGFVPTDARMRTSHSRVFAAGDVRADSVRQIGSAVGDGITAAITIQELLDTLTPPRVQSPTCEAP